MVGKLGIWGRSMAEWSLVAEEEPSSSAEADTALESVPGAGEEVRRLLLLGSAHRVHSW